GAGLVVVASGRELARLAKELTRLVLGTGFAFVGFGVGLVGFGVGLVGFGVGLVRFVIGFSGGGAAKTEDHDEGAKRGCRKCTLNRRHYRDRSVHIVDQVFAASGNFGRRRVVGLALCLRRLRGFRRFGGRDCGPLRDRGRGHWGGRGRRRGR